MVRICRKTVLKYDKRCLNFIYFTRAQYIMIGQNKTLTHCSFYVNAVIKFMNSCTQEFARIEIYYKFHVWQIRNAP